MDAAADNKNKPPLIRDVMGEDHRRIEQLLTELTAAFEANDRETIVAKWGEFDALLTTHLESEEAELIPRLSRTNEREARALLAEHKLIRMRLAELGTAVELHTIRLDTARNFVDELRAHAAHEDKLFYPWADDQLSVPERRGLFARLAAGIEEARDKRSRRRLAQHA